jgi:hypothetical protein
VISAVLTEISPDLPQSYQKNISIVLRLEQDGFLLEPLKFMIHGCLIFVAINFARLPMSKNKPEGTDFRSRDLRIVLYMDPSESVVKHRTPLLENVFKPIQYT